MNDNPTLEAARFLVDEKPYCVWEWNLAKHNLDFISALNPDYFRYVAETAIKQLDDENKMNAALWLRTTYSHALEAFFAIVGATVQSPHCISGWFLKYKQDDLESVAKKITNGHGLMNVLHLPLLNWETFSEFILSHAHFDSDEKRQRIVTGFARAWNLFAYDFTNEKFYAEYNNIKHGFRVRLGGFALAVGQETSYGVPPPKDQMRTIGSSKFGTSFFIPEKLANSPNHFRLRSISRNWLPESFASKLCLITTSMNNIISFLKITEGVAASTVKFSWPADEMHFDQFGKRNVGVTDVEMNLAIDPAQIKIFSEEEIRAQYYPAK